MCIRLYALEDNQLEYNKRVMRCRKTSRPPALDMRAHLSLLLALLALLARGTSCQASLQEPVFGPGPAPSDYPHPNALESIKSKRSPRPTPVAEVVWRRRYLRRDPAPAPAPAANVEYEFNLIRHERPTLGLRYSDLHATAPAVPVPAVPAPVRRQSAFSTRVSRHI